MNGKKLIEKIKNAGFIVTRIAEHSKTTRQNIDDGLTRKTKLSLMYVKKGLEVSIDKGQKILAEIDSEIKKGK